MESISPFLLIIAPFAIVYLLEGLVIYFFKLKRFWPAIGVSFLINLLSLGVLLGSSYVLGVLGYQFNGLQVALPVVFFLWWLSIIIDGLLLQRFTTKSKQAVFLASIVMNTISYAFFYFFIVNSQ